MTQMKAVRFETTGEPADVLHCGSAQVRAPGPGEVRVRMLASPVNPSDMMFIRGVYHLKPSCPQSPGFEGTGVIEATGGGLRGKLLRGKRAVVMNSNGGNWAEQTVVPASQVIPVSSDLSDDQAATFMVNPATAWIMTREVLQIPRGQWLLQTAAGSQLGHMIARLGKSTGFKTISVIRRDAHVDSLRDAGSDEVIVWDASSESVDELSEKIATITGADGLRYAIDPIGGSTASAVVDCLGHGAKMLLFGTLTGQPIEFSPRAIMRQDASISGFWLGNFMAKKSMLFKLRLIRRITKLIQAGVFGDEDCSQVSTRRHHISSASSRRSIGYRKSSIGLPRVTAALLRRRKADDKKLSQ